MGGSLDGESIRIGSLSVPVLPLHLFDPLDPGIGNVAKSAIFIHPPSFKGGRGNRGGRDRWNSPGQGLERPSPPRGGRGGAGQGC